MTENHSVRKELGAFCSTAPHVHSCFAGKAHGLRRTQRAAWPRCRSGQGAHALMPSSDQPRHHPAARHFSLHSEWSIGVAVPKGDIVVRSKV